MAYLSVTMNEILAILRKRADRTEKIDNEKRQKEENERIEQERLATEDAEFQRKNSSI